MSDTGNSGAGGYSSSGDAIPVFVIYALLFISPFTAGLAGLIGGVLAHVLRSPATSVAQSHIRFQIRIFWIAVLLVLPLVFALMTGLTAFFMRLAEGVDITEMDIDPWVIPVFIGAGLLAAASWVWQLGASVFGVARLAANRPIGTGME